MPWVNYFAYSLIIVINTMYLVLRAQNEHPLLFALMVMAIVFAGAGLIGLGEWYRSRQGRASDGSSE